MPGPWPSAAATRTKPPRDYGRKEHALARTLRGLKQRFANYRAIASQGYSLAIALNAIHGFTTSIDAVQESYKGRRRIEWLGNVRTVWEFFLDNFLNPMELKLFSIVSVLEKVSREFFHRTSSNDRRVINNGPVLGREGQLTIFGIFFCEMYQTYRTETILAR